MNYIDICGNFINLEQCAAIIPYVDDFEANLKYGILFRTQTQSDSIPILFRSKQDRDEVLSKIRNTYVQVIYKG